MWLLSNLMSPMNKDIIEPCSRHFSYQQLICCGETWQHTQLANLPEQPASWQALAVLASTILDPVVDQFGPIELSFGFCSAALARLIRHNPQPRIAPALDQHASHELNSKGQPICSRLGAAVDFYSHKFSSAELARFIVEALSFDRLYYYGAERPVHVSVGPECLGQPEYSGQIVWMREYMGRRIPRRLTPANFIFQLKEQPC